MVWRFDSAPQIQFSVDAMRGVRRRNEQGVRFPLVSGFDSRTRLVAREYAIGKSDGL